MEHALQWTMIPGCLIVTRKKLNEATEDKADTVNGDEYLQCCFGTEPSHGNTQTPAPVVSIMGSALRRTPPQVPKVGSSLHLTKQPQAVGPLSVRQTSPNLTHTHPGHILYRARRGC